MENFIEEFLEVTKIVESPTSYLEWAAYTVIGATLRHNVMFNFPARRTKVTPNIYVLLVGDSGATRKSTPLKIANFLLRSIGNTKLIEGRASIQGVLKELGSIKRIENQPMVQGAGGLLYSEEFAAFLVKDPATTGILTDIYDYKEEHSIILKAEETVTLKNVCVSMLSATNGAFLQDMFTKTDLYGGLVGRTFFVIEERARHKDLGLTDNTTEDDWIPLVHHLRTLSKLQGSVVLTGPAYDFYNDWYKTTDFTNHESKTGYEHRAHTHVLKLALILAACSTSFKLIVDRPNIEKAINIVSQMRKNYHKLVATVGISQNNVSQAAKEIVVCLFNQPDRALTREEILRSLFGQIDSETFDKATITLEQAKMITLGGMGTATYRLSPKGREMILGELKITSPMQ